MIQHNCDPRRRAADGSSQLNPLIAIEVARSDRNVLLHDRLQLQLQDVGTTLSDI
jgi:hypothetical protein